MIFVGQPRQPPVVLARRAFQRVAPRAQLGERAGRLVAGLLRGLQARIGARDALVDPRPLLGALAADLALDRVGPGGKPGERGLGIGREAALAGDIVVELNKPAVELGHAFPGARFLALEGLARHHQTLQGGGGPGLALAQRRQLGCGQHLVPGCLGLRAGALGDHANGGIPGLPGGAELGVGGHPAQMKQRRPALRTCAATVRWRIAYKGCFEGIDLTRELQDHVVEPQQVLLGRAQPQLRLVPARMQPGDAGSLLEHLAGAAPAWPG